MVSLHVPYKKTIFKNRLDRDLKDVLSNKKTRHLPIIVQSVDGISERIERYIKKYGGRIKEYYPFIKACYASLPPSAVKGLSTLGCIYYLSPNRPVTAHLNNLGTLMASDVAHNLGITGRNVTVALLDTGTYPHPDLIRPMNRILSFKDFVNNSEFPYDDNGHGTFTAGIIAGNGTISRSRYTGIAPEATLVSLKVLDQSGNGWTSTVLSAMQWVYDNKEKYRIKLLCLPLGCPGSIAAENDPLSRAAQVLWDSGVVLCVSIGNNGPKASWIPSPAINPRIIVVGALHNLGGVIVPDKPLARFSGRGYTAEGEPRPDFVAPGNNIVSLNSDPGFFPKSPLGYKAAQLDDYYRRGTGTSAACAAVAGALCLLLEKYEGLTPDEVKSLLKHSCRSLNLLKDQQGNGLPNLARILNSI